MITGIVYCIIVGCAFVVTKGVFYHTASLVPDIISHSENHKIIELLHFVRIKLN